MRYPARRRNPYAATLYPALLAATSGALRAWAERHAGEIDRVIGEVTDDFFSDALRDQSLAAKKITERVEAAIAGHLRDLGHPELLPLALAVAARTMAIVLARSESVDIPYRFYPYLFDFSRYAQERYSSAAQQEFGPELFRSEDAVQSVLSRLGDYTLTVRKSPDWSAKIVAVDTAVGSGFGSSRRDAMMKAVTDHRFGYLLADAALRRVGFDPKALMASIPVSRGGQKRTRIEKAKSDAIAAQHAEERRVRDQKNRETARTFLYLTRELRDALERNLEKIKDLRGLKAALPEGFTAERLGTTGHTYYIVRWKSDFYHWRGDPGKSERAIASLLWSVQRASAQDAQELINAFSQSYTPQYYYLRIER